MTLASFPGKKSSESREGGLWMDPSSFSIEFLQGKEWSWGFVVGCEWMGCVQVQKEEEKIGARLVERGRFKYAFKPALFRTCRWLAGRARVPSSVTKAQWDRENYCVAVPAGINWQSPTTASHCKPRHKSPEWQELQRVCLSVYMMWVPILFIVALTGLADRFGAPTRPTLALPCTLSAGVFPQPPLLIFQGCRVSPH